LRMYCSNLYCSELVPCPIHGAAHQPTVYERVKETAHHAADVIKAVLPGPPREHFVKVQGENIVEVKTHSLEEAVLHMPTAGQQGVASRTIPTEYETAHTWEQQHEGGLAHRAMETARHAAEVVGEKAVAAAGVVKEKAVEARGSLVETGHNARVKIDETLERNFGATAEKLQSEGEKAKETALEATARSSELVKEHLGNAASSLREQERTELQKTEAEKMQQYHSSAVGPLDNTLERNFGGIVDEAQLEAQKAKESAIHETAKAVETVEDKVGTIASSLRQQQENSAENLSRG